MDVANAHEIALLLSVLEDEGPVLVQEPRREDREHPRVRVGQRLPRPEHVEEAQRDGRHPIGASEHQAHALLVVLRQRIVRLERHALRLVRRRRHERASSFVDELPLAAAQLVERPAGRRTQLALVIEEQPLAVDTHARGHDEAPHGLLDDALHQHRRAPSVDGCVVGYVVHALSDADGRSEMEDGVDAVERPFDRRRVPHVSDDELDVRGEVRGPPAIAAMNLRCQVQVIERAYAIPVREQLVGQVRADEAGATGDQYVADRKWHGSSRREQPRPSHASRPRGCRRSTRVTACPERRQRCVQRPCLSRRDELARPRRELWTAGV